MNRQKWLCFVLAVLFSLTHSFALAAEKPKVIWRTTEWPPFYFGQGPGKGEGIYDQMIKRYQLGMPEYEHIEVDMTTPRALMQMKHQADDVNTAVCHASMLFSSLIGVAHISNANSILLPHKILARKEKADEILALSEDGGKSVSIEKLVLDKRFKGGIASYGTHHVLIKYQNHHDEMTNITLVSEDYANLVRLLFNKRVDYIVQYSPIIRYFGLRDGLAAPDIALIDIAETRQKPYIKVYVGCTKHDLGRKVISKVNEVLVKDQQRLDDIRLKWFAPAEQETLKTLYQRLRQGDLD